MPNAAATTYPQAAIDAMLAAIQFDAQGLVPAIAQQHDSGEVLMMAWMDRDAVAETMRTGRVCYWSRSRKAPWRKGDTSGHIQTPGRPPRRLRRRHPAGPGRPDRRRLPHRTAQLLLPRDPRRQARDHRAGARRHGQVGEGLSIDPAWLSRRAFLGAALVLPPGASALGGCLGMAEMFGQKPKYTLTPRGDRMVRWLQHEGHDVMMAPEALAVMGIANGGRDVPAGRSPRASRDGRYVISLINIRRIHEFVLHRRQGDVLIFHNCDTKFARLSSVRYPRNGKPPFITDTAFAEADFQQQLAFWFERMPGR